MNSAPRVVIELANAGLRAADDVTVWTRTASAEDRLELARSSVRPGDGAGPFSPLC